MRRATIARMTIIPLLSIPMLAFFGGCGDSSTQDTTSSSPGTTIVVIGGVSFNAASSANITINALSDPASGSRTMLGSGTTDGSTSIVGVSLTTTRSQETVRGVPAVKSVGSSGGTILATYWLALSTNGAVYVIRIQDNTGIHDVTPAIDTPASSAVGTAWTDVDGVTRQVANTGMSANGWTALVQVVGSDNTIYYYRPGVGLVRMEYLSGFTPGYTSYGSFDLQGVTPRMPQSSG
jgi:hypothetical protein